MQTSAKFGLVGAGLALIIGAGIVMQLAANNAAADRSAAPKTAGYAVEAGTDKCGTGWADPKPGAQTFTVKNTTIAGEDVYLQGVKNQAVYLEIEGLGSGASRTQSVVLGKGSYRFVCLPNDQTPVLGNPVSVPAGPTGGPTTPGVAPVTQNDMIPPSKVYGAWIQSQLPSLTADVQALANDVDGGNLAQAKVDWLNGHLVYETLGAAYGAFGDLDTDINGTPASGQTALSDPDLAGFHKVEALLWSGAPASAIQPVSDALLASVQKLQSTFPQAVIDPLDVGLRSHEILENALQFELTGATDAGSHTNLATLDANLTGTLEALAPLHDILAPRYPDLQKTVDWVTATKTYVETFRAADGSWTPLDSLSQTQREDLDSRVSEAVEMLAPVAAICDIRQPA
jgi:iron uptake system component EfeO